MVVQPTLEQTLIPEQDFQYPRLLGKTDGRRCFGQRERAGDQRRWINFAGKEQRERLLEGAAARSEDCKFFYYDGPGFDWRGALKCGFENQRAARLSHLLGENEAGA